MTTHQLTCPNCQQPITDVHERCLKCDISLTTSRSTNQQPKWEEFREDLIDIELKRLNITLIKRKTVKEFIRTHFISKDGLIRILASAESMETAREVRHLIKEYLLKKHD